MTEVSSITCSSFIHLALASFINLLTQFVELEEVEAISTVVGLSTNSQSPSDATIINLSTAGSSSRSVNSGSDITPAVWATASPRDLDYIK